MHDIYSTYFNSIKVRLKPDLVDVGILLLFEFQFHKGTIKTVCKKL